MLENNKKKRKTETFPLKSHLFTGNTMLKHPLRAVICTSKNRASVLLATRFKILGFY